MMVLMENQAFGEEALCGESAAICEISTTEYNGKANRGQMYCAALR
jgi:hypothetical protein